MEFISPFVGGHKSENFTQDTNASFQVYDWYFRKDISNSDNIMVSSILILAKDSK